MPVVIGRGMSIQSLATAKICFAGSICVLTLALVAGCKTTSVINLPAAETPILETILDIDKNLIVPYHASGVFEMSPGGSLRRLELRLRAIYPSDIQVKIDNNLLPEVKDSASHPELDSSGYCRISEVRVVHSSDSRRFWRVFVVLPLAKRDSVYLRLTVHDVSQNANLSDGAKEAVPLAIFIDRTGNLAPRPSAVFFDGPDHKQVRTTSVWDDSAFIADNVTLAGWLTETPSRNTGDDPTTEDWHYDIYLDNDFIERNYSATTKVLSCENAYAGCTVAAVVARPLADVMMPGRWQHWEENNRFPKIQIPLTGGNQPNASTFYLPSSFFAVELNAWHKSRHMEPVPGSWWDDPEPHVFPDLAWPFNPMRPFGQALSPPQGGDYVIITGALIEDNSHLGEFNEATATPDDRRHKCWNEQYRGHGGWLEIHPLDAIRRVEKEKAPLVRKHPAIVQVCPGTGTKYDQYLTPLPPEPPTKYSMVRYREIIDERFTDMSKVQLDRASISQYEPAKLHVEVNATGTFNAVYLLWWEEGSSPRPTPAPRVWIQPITPNENMRRPFPHP